MSVAETAAEKIGLASRIAQIEMRMSAFGSVLEAIDAQRAPLLARLSSGSGAMRALAQRQLDLLADQEVAILGKVDVGEDQARRAVAISLAPDAPAQGGTHNRVGSRFVPVNGD